jgi:hypothetical protein
MGVLVAVLLAHLRFGGFINDDDFIMLRYAERVLDGQGLTWNNNDKAHGMTAFLLLGWMLFLASFRVPLDTAMSLFSLTGTLLASLCVMYVAHRARLPRWVGTTAGAALVLFAPFSVWMFAGIGGAMLAALVGWSVVLVTEDLTVLSSRKLRAVSFLVVALLCLMQTIRPDGLLPAVAVLFVAATNPVIRSSLRRFLVAFVLPVFAFAGILALLQQWHFGTPVPHVAGVKLYLDLGLTRVGLLYLVEFIRGFFPLLLVAPVLLLPFLGRPLRVCLPVFAPLFPAVTWVLYLVWIGGDWMPGNRHFALVLVLLLVSLLRALGSLEPLFSRIPVTASRVFFVLTALVTAAVSMTAPAATRTRETSAWTDITCQGSRELAAIFSEYDPLMAVEPAGCPPYVTRFRSLDMLGLNDVHISNAQPIGVPITYDEWFKVRTTYRMDPRRGNVFMPGHGNGDGAYVWSREPDLIVTCDPIGPDGSGCFRSWFEMQDRFDFTSRYKVLSVDLRGFMSWNAWVRHDAGPLGIRREIIDGEVVSITIPAWLMTSPDTAPLRKSTGKEPHVALLKNARVETPPLELSAGSWGIFGVPSGVDLASATLCASVSGEVLEVVSDGCVATLVATSSREALLGKIVLRHSGLR